MKNFLKMYSIDVSELSELLWNCLTDLDDLTGSTQSTMKLLSEVLKNMVFHDQNLLLLKLRNNLAKDLCSYCGNIF